MIEYEDLKTNGPIEAKIIEEKKEQGWTLIASVSARIFDETAGTDEVLNVFAKYTNQPDLTE